MASYNERSVVHAKTIYPFVAELIPVPIQSVPLPVSFADWLMEFL